MLRSIVTINHSNETAKFVLLFENTTFVVCRSYLVVEELKLKRDQLYKRFHSESYTLLKRIPYRMGQGSLYNLYDLGIKIV